MNKFLRAGMLLAGTTLSATTALRAQQVYPYFVDFESDSIKAYATATPVLLNGKNWTMPGVFLGDMVPASDKYNGLHAARVRRENNTTGNNGSLTMQDDLAQGIGTITFSSARYGTETGSTLAVYYSTNAGTSWIQAGTTITPGATLAVTTIPVNVAGPARIRISKTDTSASRIDVDDIMITGNNGLETNVIVVGRTPLGLTVPLATDTLTFKFNEAIVKGTTGNVILHNATDNTTQSKPITSADIVVNGQNVTVSNISLASNKSYYVTFDSAAFIKSGGSLLSTGIYSNTAWTFSTIDTSVAPDITSLNETFTTCSDPVIGVFKYVSLTGTQTWGCSTHGNTDNSSAYINGGFSGGANDNEDWLITNAPIDLSATTNPSLQFYMETYYSGMTTKTVMVSTNYVGSGDPTLATWSTLKDVTNETPTAWTLYNNMSLSAYQTTPFYLAFKYMSYAANNGAQEWSVDDIKITSSATPPPTGITEQKLNGLGLAVLGYATTDRILLGISLKESGLVNITVYDIAGRKVFNANQDMKAGSNQFNIANVNLNKGVYVIRVNEGTNSGVIKTMVQ